MKPQLKPAQIISHPKLAPGRLALQRLVQEFGATCLKLSTEDAGMSFSQIDYWSRLSKGIVPLVVKIGGPNARNDIKQLLQPAISGFIAPMVESPYGLQNFIEALKSLTSPLQYQWVKKHINIETVTAVDQLQNILGSPFARDLDEVTIGCSDLSQSMNCAVDDLHLLGRVRKSVQMIRQKGYPASVGGGITPATIDNFIFQVRPDKFNTRLVTFKVKSGVSHQKAVRAALEFEILMLDTDCHKGFISLEEKLFRTEQLRQRLS